MKTHIKAILLFIIIVQTASAQRLTFNYNYQGTPNNLQTEINEISEYVLKYNLKTIKIYRAERQKWFSKEDYQTFYFSKIGLLDSSIIYKNEKLCGTYYSYNTKSQLILIENKYYSEELTNIPEKTINITYKDNQIVQINERAFEYDTLGNLYKIYTKGKLREEIHYNKKGLRDSIVYYRGDIANRINGLHIYKYDLQNNIVLDSSLQYHSKDTLTVVLKDKYIYNNEDQIISKISTNKQNPSMYLKTSITYNTSEIIKLNESYSNDTLLSKSIHTYNKNGLLLHIKSKRQYDKKYAEVKNTYASNGLILTNYDMIKWTDKHYRIYEYQFYK